MTLPMKPDNRSQRWKDAEARCTASHSPPDALKIFEEEQAKYDYVRSRAIELVNAVRREIDRDTAIDVAALLIDGGFVQRPSRESALARDPGSLFWKDLRCQECGEMMTNHVIVTRHATGPCDDSFTGPALPEYLEGCLVETERSGALDAFQRIAKLVEHDSPVYQIAAEYASVLAHEQRSEEAKLRTCENPSTCREGTVFRLVGDGVEARFCVKCDQRYETRAVETPRPNGPNTDDDMLRKLRWLRDTVGVDIERMFARAIKEKDGRA